MLGFPHAYNPQSHLHRILRATARPHRSPPLLTGIASETQMHHLMRRVSAGNEFGYLRRSASLMHMCPCWLTWMTCRRPREGAGAARPALEADSAAEVSFELA